MNTAYIPVILGGIMIAIGAFFIVSEIVGVFRFDYSLTKMHASALGDTGGLFFSCLGLIILNGAQPSSVKIAAIVALMWLTSPVSGHLLSMLIYSTDSEVNEKCDNQCEVEE